MGPVGIAAAGAGGILGAFSALGKGEADSARFNYQAGIAETNKRIALQNADYQRKTGENQAQQSGLKTRQDVAHAKVAQAASGINVNTGTAAALRTSVEDRGKYDQDIIRANASRRAFGYDVKAWESGEQANVFKTSASNSKTAGVLGAISSIIGGASSVSSKWSQASQAGLFDSGETYSADGSDKDFFNYA